MRRGSACRSSPCSPTASAKPARKAPRARRGCATICAAHRHPHRRAVEPRRRRSAPQDVSHRQCRLRRARPAGRPHLRRLAFRRHDRHVPVARQGARHRLRRPRLGRQRGRSVDRRDLRGDARRSRHRRLRAVPRNHAQGAGAARFALEAAARGKPVLAYKLGRSAAARELAVSHTGALAGEDDIADVFLAECGIARVDTLEGLIEGFPLLARVPARARGARAPAVAVVTTTAGGATMVVDPLATRGIAVEPPSAADAGAPQGRHRHRRRAGADRRPDARRRAIRRDEGRARRADHRARVRSGRGGGRLLGALLSRSRGQADHRQRRRAESRSRRFWCRRRPTRWRGSPPPACRTSTRRRPAPTRSRRRCGAARRGRSKSRPRTASGSRAHARRARGLCAARPARRAARAVDRARRRASRKRPPCPSPIRSRSRRCRRRSRTSPTSAASCSTCATMRRCWPRSGKSGKPPRPTACWCSR